MINIFVGYDRREAAVFHVLTESLIHTSSEPFALTPLHSPMLQDFDGQRDGSNAFIYSRFLVPELMGYEGWAIYMDSDMLVREDILRLWKYRDESKAVMVVHHNYETTRTVKYVDTPLECRNDDYPKKNWSSLILWNCGHERNKILTRQFVAEAGGAVLHRFTWLQDDLIGRLPRDWNHLVGEYPKVDDAKNVHYTLGAPGFQYYADCDYAGEWHKYLLHANEMAGEDPEKMIHRSKHGF